MKFNFWDEKSFTLVFTGRKSLFVEKNVNNLKILVDKPLIVLFTFVMNNSTNL